MKYLRKFIQDTMFVDPMGEVTYTEGFEAGQYELLVNDQETGIYFMAADYATWLEKQLDNLSEAFGDDTVDLLEYVYKRLRQISTEHADYMQSLAKLIIALKRK